MFRRKRKSWFPRAVASLSIALFFYRVARMFLRTVSRENKKGKDQKEKNWLSPP